MNHPKTGQGGDYLLPVNQQLPFVLHQQQEVEVVTQCTPLVLMRAIMARGILEKTWVRLSAQQEGRRTVDVLVQLGTGGI